MSDPSHYHTHSLPQHSSNQPQHPLLQPMGHPNHPQYYPTTTDQGSSNSAVYGHTHSLPPPTGGLVYPSVQGIPSSSIPISNPYQGTSHSSQQPKSKKRRQPKSKRPIVSDYDKGQALNNASKRGDHDEVSRLLSDGADVNYRDESGDTPLIWASIAGHHEIMNTLINKGADVNAKNITGWTPLMFASRNGHHNIVSTLINKGADINVKDDYENTVFDLVKQPKRYGIDNSEGHMKCLRLLESHARSIGMELSDNSSQNGDKRKEQKRHSSTGNITDDDPYFIKAIAEGGGHLKPAVVVMHGPPGAGKTSVKQLLLGRPPLAPNQQNSTGVVERPIRTCRVKSRGGVDILCEVNKKEFLQMVAEDVHEETKTLKQNVSEKPPQHDSLEPDMLSQHHLVSHVDVPLRPSSSHIGPPSVLTQPSSSSDVPLVNPPPNTTQLKEPILERNTSTKSALKLSKIVKDIRKLISSGSKSSRDLFDLDWIYLVDSGGQPQFADILPFLFQSEEALYIVVIRLDQDLDERHNSYYCANGVTYQLPETLELTNRQLIERDCQIAEAQSTKSSQKKVIVVATRLDLITNPEACVKKLNKELMKLQKKYPNVLVAKDVTTSKVAFPVNAMATGNERKMYTDELQKCLIAIVKRSIKPIEVPLRWFVYELELEEESQSSHGVLEKSKCVKLGAVLSMSPEEVEESLRFFNRIAIHLYHPDIHDLVLTRMDPLTERLSALVKISFQPPQFDSIGDSLRLKKCGLFKRSYLPVVFEKISDSHCISDDAFLKITQYLNVIVSVGLDDYFIPSALSVNTDHNITDQPYTPCTFSWGDRIIPPGFFFSLIVTLLHLVDERSFTYFYLATENVSQSRDRITLYSNAYGGMVTFFNQQKYIWVHYIGRKPPVGLADYIKVLKLVVEGLHLAIRNLTKIRKSGIKFPLISCFCPVCDDNRIFHPCLFTFDGNSCICPSNRSKMVPIPEDMKLIMYSLQDVISKAAADSVSLGNDECCSSHMISSSELNEPQVTVSGKRTTSQRDSGKTTPEIDSKKPLEPSSSSTQVEKSSSSQLKPSSHSGILKKHTGQLMVAIGNPNSLAMDMWSGDLITDGLMDDVTTTTGLTNQDKLTKLLRSFWKTLSVDSTSTAKKGSLLKTFCDILKNQRTAALDSVIEDMETELNQL